MKGFKKISNLLLLGILLGGFVLRFIFINSNPAGMHADEADTGYTALTLIKTGMDPYGNPWPLHFQDQANNYRAPLYTYADIPFVFFLGLNPLSERLPSVIFGVILIYVVYRLLLQYFKDNKIALTGALLTAINPWSIHLSRTGLEVLLSLLLVASGLLFFELSKSKKYFLILSSVVFSLSLFAYHPAKIFTPLIIIVLLLFNFKHIIKLKVYFLVSLSIFVLATTVIGFLAIGGKGAAEFHNASIFNNQRAKEVVDQQRTNSNAPLIISSIFSNKLVYYLREFTNVYIGPLSLNYLYINGDNNLDKGIGNYGQFHLFEVPAFLLGIILLFKKYKKTLFFFSLWFFLSLIPGGITKSGNYAYRDVFLMMPMLFVTSVGFVELFSILRQKKYRLMGLAYVSVSAVLLTFFFYNYFYSYPVFSRDWWGYSQKEALAYARNIDRGSPVVIHGAMDWAVLYAFYHNVKPEVFQKAYKERMEFNGRPVVRIDNLYIGTVVGGDGLLEYPPDLPQKAYVITPYGLVDGEPVKIFYASDGGSNLTVYEKKK